MSDLGLTLAWLAVQVALLMVPALALQAVASRRGPAAAGWVAALSLGLVLALRRRDPGSRGGASGHGRSGRHGRTRACQPGIGDEDLSRRVAIDSPARRVERRLDASGLRLTWARFERGAAAPAARCRPWGTAWRWWRWRARGSDCCGCWSASGPSGSAAAGAGRSTTRASSALLDELRHAMGCRQRVDFREVSELTTPATAGWWQPVVLLPDDWRSWDDADGGRCSRTSWLISSAGITRSG